ncbi:MAG: hypothetical protein CTY10_00410 [Methylotenera sp.]|nr:MAG: hypothetical protein CTY10_00410 [Methylotenera sp.]
MNPKLLTFYKKILRISMLIGESVSIILKIIIFDVLWETLKVGLVVGLPLASLFVLYELAVKNSQIESLGIYVLTPLAVLIALSSLLYSRARAVNVENHSASLLAAERVLLATIFYAIAILWGFVVTSFNLMFSQSGGRISPEILSIIYLPSFVFAGYAYIDVFKTLSLVFKELKSK